MARGRSTDNVKIVATFDDQASNQIETTSKALRNNLGGAASEANNNLSKMLSTAAKFIGAGYLAKMTMDLSKMGQEALGIRKTFESSFNPEFFNELTQAVGGTANEIDLMRAAVQGIDLGATNEQLKTFAEYARLQAFKTGGDTMQVFGEIVSGVMRGSTALLDNFGISALELDKKVRELAGGEALFQFMSETQKRTLKADAALKMMSERVENFGEAADEMATSEAWRRFNTNLLNIRQNISNLLALPVARVLNRIGDSLNYVTGEQGKVIRSTGAWVVGLSVTAIALKQIVKRTLAFGGALISTSKWLTNAAVEAIITSSRLKGLLDVTSGLFHALTNASKGIVALRFGFIGLVAGAIIYLITHLIRTRDKTVAVRKEFALLQQDIDEMSMQSLINEGDNLTMAIYKQKEEIAKTMQKYQELTNKQADLFDITKELDAQFKALDDFQKRSKQVEDEIIARKRKRQKIEFDTNEAVARSSREMLRQLEEYRYSTWRKSTENHKKFLAQQATAEQKTLQQMIQILDKSDAQTAERLDKQRLIILQLKDQIINIDRETAKIRMSENKRTYEQFGMNTSRYVKILESEMGRIATIMKGATGPQAQEYRDYLQSLDDELKSITVSELSLLEKQRQRAIEQLNLTKTLQDEVWAKERILSLTQQIYGTGTTTSLKEEIALLQQKQALMMGGGEMGAAMLINEQLLEKQAELRERYQQQGWSILQAAKGFWYEMGSLQEGSTQVFLAGYDAWIEGLTTGNVKLGQLMLAQLKTFLKTKGSEHAAEALSYAAKGKGYLSNPVTAPLAGGAFAAAIQHAAVATAFGVGAASISRTVGSKSPARGEYLKDDNKGKDKTYININVTSTIGKKDATEAVVEIIEQENLKGNINWR